MCERLICYPWKYPVYLLDLVSWLVTQKDMLCKQKCKTPSLPINLLNLVGQSLVKPIILQTKWYQCKLGTLLTLCKLLWNRSFIFSRKTQVSSSLSDGKMVFYVLAIKPWVVLCTFCLQMECLSELIVSRRYRIYACWVKVIMPERSRYRTSENTYLHMLSQKNWLDLAKSKQKINVLLSKTEFFLQSHEETVYTCAWLIFQGSKAF